MNKPTTKLSDAAITNDLSKVTRDTNTFPVEVFPERLQQIIQNYSRSTGAPECFLGGAILTTAGAALGNAAKVINGNFSANAILFLCVVAGRGKGKTHSIDFILKPLAKIDTKAQSKYKSEHAAWKAAVSNIPKKKQSEPEPLPPPQFVPTDATYEGIIALHERNEKGMLVYRDEISGFVDGFDQYSKGAESQKWLQLWNGNFISVSRKGSPPIRIENPHISLIGGIQPEILPKLAEKSRISNGFLDRFLFCYPEKCKAAPDNPEETNRSAWDDCVTTIHSVKPFINNETGEVLPRLIRLSEEARIIIAKNSEKLMTIVNEADDKAEDCTGGIAAKLRIYQSRFALILQAIRYGCGECTELDTIDEISANGAVLLTDYFFESALKVHGEISEGGKRAYNIRRVHRLIEQGKTYRQIEDLIGIKIGTISKYSKLTP